MTRKHKFQLCMNELVCLQIVNEENRSEDKKEEDLPTSVFDRYNQEMLKSVENVKICSQSAIHKIRVSYICCNY